MKKNIVLTCGFIFCWVLVKAQSVGSSGANVLGQINSEAIVTAVPSLTISPDARSGALADAGAAISPDANASYWNSAKLAFVNKQYGGSLSYNPWLRKLVPDMSLNYLTGYTKLRKEEALSLSLMYFNMGSIQFTDAQGNQLNKFSPQEFSIGGNYSRKLSQYFSVGAGLKFIHSNLTGSTSNTGGVVKSANAAAVDLGIYHTKDFTVPGSFKKYNWSWGINVSNIGNKVSYSDANHTSFIPSNLRLGTAFTTELDPYNKFTFIIDANKLMVPAPPVYELNSAGTADTVDAKGNPIVLKGQNPAYTGIVGGVIGSFYKAPGGLKEEWQEIRWSFATEYWYNNLFAARAGFFYENKYTGDRKYFTMGFGIRYNYFGLDAAYLIPIVINNPLAETLRFTLHIDMVGKKQESVIE